MMIADTNKFRSFAEAAACLEPCMMTGRIDPDQIKILMGEKLDLWPMSIFAGRDEPIDADDLAATLAELDRLPERAA